MESVEALVFYFDFPPILNLDEETFYSKKAYLLATSFLSIIQNMIETWPIKMPKIIILTKGIVPVMEDQPQIDPTVGIIFGMFRNFLSEIPDLAGKLIDLDPDEKDALFDISMVIINKYTYKEFNLTLKLIL